MPGTADVPLVQKLYSVAEYIDVASKIKNMWLSIRGFAINMQAVVTQFAVMHRQVLFLVGN